MHKIALSGACGRMGVRIASLIADANDLRLSATIEHKDHPSLGKTYGQVVGLPKIKTPITARLDEKVDVVIDFASPDSAEARLDECLKTRTALLIGTTGLPPETQRRIKAAGHFIPILPAPNMSVGVNLLFHVAAEVARLLGDSYDIEIVEAHHRFKKDSPSGTALRLAQGIADALGRDLKKNGVYGRSGACGERDAREIGIHAVRAGDIIGEHTVIYSNLGERIELTHRAHSRDTFAQGAVRAARFLAQARPGLYTIDQAFGLVPGGASSRKPAKAKGKR